MTFTVNDQPTYRAAINSLAVRPLVAVMRAMNGGKLGYDYSKKSKAELQAHAHTLAQDYAIKCATYEKAWGNIQNFLKDQREETDGGADGTMALKGGMADETDNDESETDTSGDRDGKLSPPGGGGESEDGRESKGDAPDEGRGQGDGKDGDGKDKAKGKAKGKPKKEPETAEEKLAALMKEIMGKGDEDGDEEPKTLTPEQIEKLVQKMMEDRAAKNAFKVEVWDKSDPLSVPIESPEQPRHEVFKEVLHAVNQGLNVLLVGPAGCGKTFMAKQVAMALALKFRFSGAVASEYKLLGFMNSLGMVVRTDYREAYEFGGVFLWDEMDASGAQPMLSFNAGLSNDMQDFPDAIVTRHKDFRAIAAANTYGTGADRQYVGRNQLDAASLDRFYVIEMDYDNELEKALYGNGEWVRYVQAARKASRSVGIRHVVSMRAIDMGLRMMKTGISRGNIEKAVLWKHLKKDDVTKIKNAMGL